VRVLSVANRYAPWSAGGYEVVSAAAVDALAAAGHRTRVLTTLPDPSDRPHEGPSPPDVHRDLRWYWRAGAFPSITLRETVRLERFNAAVMRRHLDEFVPDAVVWWGMGGMSLSLLAQVHRAGLRSLGLVGDEWMLYGPSVDAWTRRWRGAWRLTAPLCARIFGVPTRLDLDGSARWLFNSAQLLQAVRDAGWRMPGAEIAPPGVEQDLFAAREPEPWRWRLLYCGRADRRKGVATAVEALGRLPAQAELTVHGDGDEAFLAELRSLASNLGVGERVHFTHGPHRQVPAAYAASDAVLFPATWREPWGLVPLEAMAVGRPLVAARSQGGPGEYLEDGRNCLQFEPGDAAGLAAAVCRIGSDPALRERLVSAGRATASRFTARAFNERLEAELRALASGSDPTR
jgi:glycosyltransferase involved in cell wall biosynthesis